MTVSPWRVTRRRALSLLGAAGATMAFSGTSVADSGGHYIKTHSDTVTIGNDHVEVVLSKARGTIQQLTNRDTGIDLVDPSDGTASWRAGFYNGTHDDLVAAPGHAGKPTIATNKDANTATVTLTWDNPLLLSQHSGPTGDSFKGSVTVRVKVTQNSPNTHWRASVKNDGDRAIAFLTVPVVRGVKPLGDSDSLVVPLKQGRLINNPTAALQSRVRMRYPCGEGPMQFSAYYGQTGGFYVNARDSVGHVKRQTWKHQHGPKDRLQFEYEHFFSKDPGADQQTPYETVIGSFAGDWHDAAERYRAWAKNSSLLPDSPPPIPNRAVNVAVSSTATSYFRPQGGINQPNTPYDKTVSEVVKLRKFLNVPLTGVRWLGWEKHGMPPGGDSFPPHEGMAAFKRALSKFESNGVRTVPIYHGKGIKRVSDYFASHPNSPEMAIHERDGKPLVKTDHHGLKNYMLSYVESDWEPRVRRHIQKLAEAGASELALDGLSWDWSPGCYDENHDHPVGRGGNWWAKRTVKLLKDSKGMLDAHGPSDTTVSGEGITDAFLPWTNVVNTRDPQGELMSPLLKRGVGRQIPLFTYTFGDLVVVRGINNTPLVTRHGNSRIFLQIVTGRQLVWGTIPEINHVPVPLSKFDAKLKTYLKRVAQARTYWANRFLAHGRLLRTPDIPSVQISAPGPKQTNVTFRSPAVLSTAWRSPQGEVGVVLTNVSGSKQSVRLDRSAQPFKTPAGPYLVYGVRNGTYQRLSGDTSLSVTLAPRDIQLVVIRSHSAAASAALDALVAAENTNGVAGSDLDAAKRAFEHGEWANAKQKATAASKTLSTPVNRTTSEANTSTATTTNGASPGFTATEGLGAGLLAAAARTVHSVVSSHREDSNSQTERTGDKDD